MVVLDTCALIWLAGGDPMRPDAVSAISVAARSGSVVVPAIALWEVLGLVRKAKLKIGTDTPTEWVRRALEMPGVRVEPLDIRIAIDAGSLPGEFHNDPGDRFIVATARILGAPVVTRDHRILSYGRVGHVAAIAC